VNNFKNLTYKLIESALPNDVLDCISNAYTHGTEATIESPLKGVRLDPHSRRSNVQFYDRDTWVAALMKHLIWTANEAVWQYDLREIQVVQLTSYGEGDFFSWHKDTGDGPYGPNSRPEWRDLVRKLSVTLLLSKQSDCEGGEFQIKDEYGHVWRDPGFVERGNAIVFPSNLLHQVLPIKAGRRLSAVAWALGPPLR
jgi:PKHD-type hydroxylase